MCDVKTYFLQRRQILETDSATAWRFFSNPFNLPRITPPWLDFQIINQPPETVYAGLIITYRLRPLGGIALSWVSEITQVHPPDFFVDEQRQGPYRFWHHHHFLRSTKTGVENIDGVHYGLPYGLLGIMAHGTFIRRQLMKIFDYRRHALHHIFNFSGSGDEL